MTIDPHWLELLVVPLLIGYLKWGFGRIERKLDLIDKHETQLAVADERSKRQDLERAEDRKQIGDIWGVLRARGIIERTRRSDE